MEGTLHGRQLGGQTMSQKTSRPSPSASAASLPVGTRMTGTDGNVWEVTSTVRGVHRWSASRPDAKPPKKAQPPKPKRQPRIGPSGHDARQSGQAPGTDVEQCFLTAVLPISLDDRCVRQRARDRIRVPHAAQSLVRRLVKRNAFKFEGISFDDGVPLKRSLIERLFGTDAKNSKKTSVRLAAYELVEKPHGRWSVQLSWLVRGASASEVDLDGVRRHLDGHFVQGLRSPSGLIYGWGWRLEDERFGPMTACNDDGKCRVIRMSDIKHENDVDGQFAFNLSIEGSMIE